MDEVKNKIQDFRKGKKITQSEIAKHLGISQAAYAKMESGKTKISLDKLHLISDFLDVSIVDLLGDSSITKISFPPEDLRDEIERLKKQIEQKDKLIDFLQEESNDLKYLVAFIKITKHFEGIINDEKFVRSIKEPETIPQIEVRINAIKEHLANYFKSGILSENSILSILFNNFDFINLMENESETKEDFIKKSATYINRFFNIGEKEIEKYIEINLNLKWDSKLQTGNAWKNKSTDFKDFWKKF